MRNVTLVFFAYALFLGGCSGEIDGRGYAEMAPTELPELSMEAVEDDPLPPEEEVEAPAFPPEMVDSLPGYDECAPRKIGENVVCAAEQARYLPDWFIQFEAVATAEDGDAEVAFALADAYRICRDEACPDRVSFYWNEAAVAQLREAVEASLCARQGAMANMLHHLPH